MPSAIPFIDEMPDLRARLARIRVLYTDLDGTLLGRGASLFKDGEGRPSLDAASAVLDLNSAGLKAVICSGRNAKQLMEVTRLLGWDDFLAELGCVRSYDRGARRVFDTGVWGDGAAGPGETPYEAISRVGALTRLQTAFPNRIENHDPWHVDRDVTHVLRGSVPLVAAQAVLDGLPLPVTIVDNGIIHPPRHGLLDVDEVHAYHLVPTGVSKPHSIAADLIDRGLEPTQAMAIGDSMADVAMADSVGLMVCVRNGLDDPALVAHARERSNVAATRESFGSGWRELVQAWLASRPR